MADRIGWIDWLVVGLYLGLVALAAVWFARRQKSTEAYFVGGRSVPGWAVGLSLFGSSISTATFLAYPGHGTHPPQVVYWLREGRKANAEVDFVIASGPDVFPIEVKAGRSGTLRSLHQFAATGKAAAAVRFDTNPPSRQRVVHQAPMAQKLKEISFVLLSLPLYAAGELDRLLLRERDRLMAPT